MCHITLIYIIFPLYYILIFLPYFHRVDVGVMHRFRYDVVDTKNIVLGQLSIDSTRPETILGDMAVAVHPEDSRYKVWGAHVDIHSIFVFIYIYPFYLFSFSHSVTMVNLL